MSSRRLSLLFGAGLLLGACDSSRPTSDPPPRPAIVKPDLSFQLTPEQRANLVRGIDANALEKLAQRLPADSREMFLASFLKPKPGELAAPRIVGMTTEDEAIRGLLEEVWAPTWTERGLEAIETSREMLPGREIAKARLKALKNSARDTR